MLYTMRTEHARTRIILLLAGLLLLFSAAAQEQSIRPGSTVYAIDISSTFIDNILRT